MSTRGVLIKMGNAFIMLLLKRFYFISVNKQVFCLVMSGSSEFGFESKCGWRKCEKAPIKIKIRAF